MFICHPMRSYIALTFKGPLCAIQGPLLQKEVLIRIKKALKLECLKINQVLSQSSMPECLSDWTDFAVKYYNYSEFLCRPSVFPLISADLLHVRRRYFCISQLYGINLLFMGVKKTQIKEIFAQQTDRK